MNTFGNIFRLTSFGESHGKAIGGVIDGCPAGLDIDMQFIRKELNRRRPGQSHLSTPRHEPDDVHFLSGIYDGKTTGTPIGFMIVNSDINPSDYDKLKYVYRPSHADYTYQQKYGIRDHRGGGRSSARETAIRCVGGAIAKLALKQTRIQITAFTSQVGCIQLDKDYTQYDLSVAETNLIRTPDAHKAIEMSEFVEKVRERGDTVGGIITCIIQGVPPGLGEPVFGKLHTALGNAMLSINAAKGFDYGDGFDVSHCGSEVNDEFLSDNGRITTRTNHSGGIQGGISNGEDIYFRVAFKPVPTLMMDQDTVNIKGDYTRLYPKGRHDACVLPRAVPVVEAMAAMTILDFHLLNKSTRL